MESTPGGTDIGQSHMGSMKTPNVSLVTPSMLLILEPDKGDVQDPSVYSLKMRTYKLH